MEIGSLSLILIVGLLILISIGVPMGFASGFMGAVLVFLYIGEHALGILLSRYYSLVVTYSFLSVPLFIFMASLLERSNIARDLYDALNAWLRKTRGGVGVVTAIMATIMAAMSGIIGGEIVLLGLIFGFYTPVNSEQYPIHKYTCPDSGGECNEEEREVVKFSFSSFLSLGFKVVTFDFSIILFQYLNYYL